MADTLAPFEKDEASTPIVGTRYRVNALLADRVNRLIADSPPDIKPALEHAITSGYRSYEQQTAAYLHHLAGGGLAARPGHSWHERLNGMAVDWNEVTPQAWAYLRAAAPHYGLGFPLGAADPFHMQPVETYAGGVNRVASALENRRVPAPAPPSAYDDLTPAEPALKVAPINPVPVPSAMESTLGQTIVTKPTPMTVEPFHPIQGPRAILHMPNLASGFRQALNTILRQR